MIYIYDDGVHGNVHLQLALKTVLPDADIRFCTASMILSGDLGKCNLLVIPGGADLYYCEKLNGRGNQVIRDFVAQGGSYLGTCAGAYYACTTLDWNKGEISGIRELAFYEGCANGPVYDWIENPISIYDGSWKKAVRIKTEDGDSILTLYDGGPVFAPHPSFAHARDTLSLGRGKANDSEQDKGNHEIIARYTDLPDQPPAIIGGTFGKGRYVLSSPHIEKFGHLLDDGLYKLFNQSYEREKKVHEELLPYEATQKEFLKSILERLL